MPWHSPEALTSEHLSVLLAVTSNYIDGVDCFTDSDLCSLTQLEPVAVHFLMEDLAQSGHIQLLPD